MGLGLIVSIIFGFLLILALFNWRAFARILGVGKAQVGKLADNVERIDPVALVRQKIAEETAKLNGASESLAKQKAICFGIERLIAAGEKESTTLEGRIEYNLKKGEERVAADCALELKQVQRTLADNRQSLAQAEASRLDFKRQVDRTEASIRKKTKDIESKANQLEISKAQADMADTTRSFAALNSSFADINRHEDEIQKQIDANKAKAFVSHEQNAGVLAIEAEYEDQEQEEAKILLEGYKKKLEVKNQAAKEKDGFDKLFPIND